MNIETPAPDEIEPHRLTADHVLSALGTDPRAGLTQAQARERLRRYGRNELAAETPVPAWRKFLGQFTDWLVILLILAASISGGLWLYERDTALPYEAIAIFAIVLLNALMGYVQQARAEQALAALQQMSAAHANVIRDGTRQSIPATELVPGDLLLVEEGDSFPADARLIQSTALQTAEAALTGESLPVSKDVAVITGEAAIGDRHNMIFSGTAATYGRGRAVVTATGMNTEMGHIAGMLKDAPDEITPLQEELDRVGKLLGVAVVVIAIIMIGTILLVQNVRGASAIFDVAYFAAIPTQSWVRIVETDMVPKSFVTGWHLAAVTTGEKEPTGQRIIEVPEDLEQFVSRHSRSRFVAYVPNGSIQKGQQLATTGGNGKTVQCSLCHGPELKGVGPIPGIAGRSPTYTVRQLYDFKHGARAGSASQLMTQSVEKLTIDDMTTLAAYVASLKP